MIKGKLLRAHLQLTAQPGPAQPPRHIHAHDPGIPRYLPAAKLLT